jgi:O-acetyl-ADP-ribose deacetylase (regulator of RNase III)
MNKLRVLPVAQACECPFYVKDTSGANHCFVKHTVPLHLAAVLVEDTSGYDSNLWSADCKGSYSNCSVIPLLWNLDAPQVETQLVSTDIDDYDPFASSDDSTEAPSTPAEEQSITQEPEPTVEPVTPKISVTIHQVENPYNVKADVLVTPANIVLTVDDSLLNRMSRGGIQRECDALQRPILMGNVYITGNGGEGSKVKPKAIIHAVVSGPSRLVNEQDIKSSIRKSIHLADELGAKTMVMLPCDCGTHDVADAARVQLSAIKTFINSVETKNITNIFIVMEDYESIEIFKDYFGRIFE